MALLKNDFLDADTMATAHAAHHNALATAVNVTGPAYLPGRYYDQRLTHSAVSAQGLFNNMAYYLPIFLSRAQNVDRVGISVGVAAAAGGTARLGLSAINASTGVPTTTLFDWGTVATDAIATPQITITATLPIGWSYLVLVTSSHTAPDINHGSSSFGIPIFLGATAIGSTSAGGGIRTTATGGAIPAPLATLAAYTAITTTTNQPLIYFRAAA